MNSETTLDKEIFEKICIELIENLIWYSPLFINQKDILQLAQQQLSQVKEETTINLKDMIPILEKVVEEFEQTDNKEVNILRRQLCNPCDFEMSMENAIHQYEIKNYKQSASIFKHYAALGDAPAKKYLGVCYLLGNGVDRNDMLAFYYFSLSALQGYAPAECCLGAYYESKGEIELAKKHYKSAASKNNKQAQKNLEKLMKI